MEQHDSIMLNNFNRKDVLDIVEIIKNADSDIIVWDFYEEEGPLELLYVPYLHRLQVSTLSTDRPLYPNPTCTVLMMPRGVFIKNVAPNELYHEVMKS